MKDLLHQLDKLKSHYNQRVGEFNSLKSRIEQVGQQQKETETNMKTLKEAGMLLAVASQTAREFIIKKFNEVVTFALQSVFGDDYKFETAIEFKHGSPWATFSILSTDYEDAADPLDSRGGGVTDIVAIALRIVLLELSSPKIEGPLLFDEPTKQLSKEFSSFAAELLTTFSKRMNRQIILVTHDQILAKESDTKVEL